MNLIDSHCHLEFADFTLERDAVVGRARAAGIGRIITISTRVEEFASICSLATTYPDVYCTVGTHPDYACEESGVTADHLAELAAHPKCIGIGETGLDYHYDKTPREVAKSAFRTHISAARKTGLPLIVHARDADEDMAAILRDEMGKGAFAGLLHCFTSSRSLADTALSLGFYISFSGVLTFKKADALRDIARAVPLDRLLVETDAPFLAPVPYRGKRNEPSFVVETAKLLADLKEVEISELAARTTTNALRLFTKMPPLARECAGAA